MFAADLQLVFGWDRVALVVPDRLFELGVLAADLERQPASRSAAAMDP